MNLANNPKIEELQELLAKCDETLGHHFLWVRNDGQVFIPPLPETLPSVLDDELGKQGMQFRIASFWADYVGHKGSQGKDWVDALFKGICKLWADKATGFVENW